MTVTSTTTATRLEFPRGAQRLTVRVEVGMPTLHRARFGGSQPTVHEADGTLTIDYPRLAPSGLLGLARRSAEITLNPRVAWDLALGGVSGMSGDLRGLDLRSLEISGGVSGLDLELPTPRGVVPLRIRGGAQASPCASAPARRRACASGAARAGSPSTTSTSAPSAAGCGCRPTTPTRRRTASRSTSRAARAA